MKKCISLVLCSIASVGYSATVQPDDFCEQSTQDVVLYRGNLGRTGFYDTAPLVELRGIKWIFEPSGGRIWSAAPLVVGDILYSIQAHLWYLRAVDMKTGKLLWTVEAGLRAPTDAAPVPYEGAVYIGTPLGLVAVH